MVGIKQPVQGTAYSVIAHLLQQCCIEPECLRGISADGFMLAVQWLTFNQYRPKQNSQSLGIGQPNTAVVGRHKPFQASLKIEAFEKVIDQGKGAQSLGF